MKIKRVSAIWCSSCLIMKSRVSEIIRDGYDLEIEEIDFDDEEGEALLKEKGIPSEILPIYFREDDKYLIGEKSKEEFIEFLESDA